MEADDVFDESEVELGGREDEVARDVMAAAEPSKDVTEVGPPGIRRLLGSEQQPWYTKSRSSQQYSCTDGQ